MANYLIVGADRGIGLAICRQLASRGDDVIAACMESGEAHAGTSVVVIPRVDVTSDA
ncbi:unnamed protein product, partial [marine sediment metagenome]